MLPWPLQFRRRCNSVRAASVLLRLPRRRAVWGRRSLVARAGGSVFRLLAFARLARGRIAARFAAEPADLLARLLEAWLRCLRSESGQRGGGSGVRGLLELSLRVRAGAKKNPPRGSWDAGTTGAGAEPDEERASFRLTGSVYSASIDRWRLPPGSAPGFGRCSGSYRCVVSSSPARLQRPFRRRSCR